MSEPGVSDGHTNRDLCVLDFPREICHIDGGRVSVCLPRDQLAALRSFAWAVEVGLTDQHFTPRGHG